MVAKAEMPFLDTSTTSPAGAHGVATAGVRHDRVVRSLAPVSLGLGAPRREYWRGTVSPYLCYGRRQPLNTSAAGFGLVGNIFFAGV
jgi:hypothetical protein